MKGENQKIEDLIEFITNQKESLVNFLENEETNTKNSTEEISMKPLFSDNVYNVLKWVVMILLPALGAGYFALGGIWNLPYPEEVLGTIMVVTSFLGALIGVSTAQYNNVNR